MPLAEVFAALITAGYGRSPDDIGRHLTFRQIRRFYALCQKQRDIHRSDLIEAAAVAWGGEPAKVIRQLREEP